MAIFAMRRIVKGVLSCLLARDSMFRVHVGLIDRSIYVRLCRGLVIRNHNQKMNYLDRTATMTVEFLI